MFDLDFDEYDVEEGLALHWKVLCVSISLQRYLTAESAR